MTFHAICIVRNIEDYGYILIGNSLFSELHRQV